MFKIIDLSNNNVYLVNLIEYKKNFLFPFNIRNIFINNKKIYFYFYNLYKNGFIKNLRKINSNIKYEYIIILKLNGIGYKVIKLNNNLSFILGYSHFIKFKIMPFINIQINIDNKILKIITTNKEFLGIFIFMIISLRKIEVYKGKGIQNIFSKLNLKLKRLKK